MVHMRLGFGKFFGSPMRRRRVDGFLLVETLHEPNTVIPPHSHEHAHFSLQLEGSSVEHLGDVERQYIPQILTFHPADEVHSNRIGDAGSRCLNIQLTPAMSDRVREVMPNWRDPAFFDSGPAAWVASRLYKEFRRRDPVSSLALEALCLELLVESVRSNSPSAEDRIPRWLLQVRDRLHEEYHTDIAVTDLATEAQVHPAHLARAFRQRYGATVGEYVRRLRIESACKQLLDSSMPISEIAESMGFCDQAYFSKVFRNEVGVTPGQYRRGRGLR